MRGGLFVAILLAVAPAPVLAENLYVDTGKLVDVAAGKVLTGQCISIADDKITAVAPCGATPAGAERIDWSPYTVLPGLIDLHTHLADAGQSANLTLPIKPRPPRPH
jgi:imidazolonepropionase-like amidohydrolase